MSRFKTSFVASSPVTPTEADLAAVDLEAVADSFQFPTQIHQVQKSSEANGYHLDARAQRVLMFLNGTKKKIAKGSG